LGGQLAKSVQLDGLDVSFNATPPLSWLPPISNLRHGNMITNVPDDLVALYEIVPIRNFALVLQIDGVLSVLDHLIKLIRMVLP